MRVQDLSKRAREVLCKAIGGEITREAVARLSRRDVLMVDGCGTKTANEVKTWAARHGIEMPFTSIKPGDRP